MYYQCIYDVYCSMYYQCILRCILYFIGCNNNVNSMYYQCISHVFGYKMGNELSMYLLCNINVFAIYHAISLNSMYLVCIINVLSMY